MIEKLLTHVHDQVFEQQCNHRNHKGAERNPYPVLDTNPDDSPPRVKVSVTIGCQSPGIVTGHVMVNGRGRLNQWCPILFDGEAYDEIHHK